MAGDLSTIGVIFSIPSIFPKDGYSRKDDLVRIDEYHGYNHLNNLQRHKRINLMGTLVLVLVFLLLGIFIFMSYTSRKIKINDNLGRRSGGNRRKSFIASKNRMRRSDKDRRELKDRRNKIRTK